MKVLIVSDAWHPQVNGVVRTYEHLAEELIKLGHTVDIIGPADFPLTIPMPGYAEIKLAIKPYKRLAQKIEALNPSTIHIATEGPLGLAARRYCLRYKRAFTTSYHTHFPDYVAKRVGRYLPFLHELARNLAKDYERRFHAPAKTLMIATQSLEDELKSWGFKTPIHRLSRGVDLERFYPGPKELFQDLPRPVMIYVGRVAIEKNLEDFLSMDIPGSKVIVGDGPSMAELKAKYPSAHFVGTKTGEDLAAHYRAADVFAFPSRTDTFGMVLVEALASGLPVAAYNVTGPKDIITESFLGALEEHDLKAATLRALNCGTPAQRADYIKRLYTWESAGKQFEKGLLLATP